jgi:hypothetical protein
MKRPKKYITTLPIQTTGANTISTIEYYNSADIDPLLDELERLKTDKKPFPSFEEFEEWYSTTEDFNYDECHSNNMIKSIYNYFAQFQYEKTVFPKVGEEYEFSGTGGSYVKRVLRGFITDTSCTYPYIRPTTTREEVIAQVESKLNSNELTFDRELVEQFLNILKGQDDG